MKLTELAKIVGGTITGDPATEIRAVCGIENAGQGDITLFADKKNLDKLSGSKVSVIIVREEIENIGIAQLIVENPMFVFARVLEVFHKKAYIPSGINEKAIIGDNTNMGSDVSVHALAIISNNVTIGSEVVISSGTFIGEGVSIGNNSFIYPNVTIREDVIIGENVIIHSGSVIGSDGFGYVPEKGSHYKVPQVGNVIIEDNVEIGSNVAVDRATTGSTIIGSGTKIDNLVQIGHNVKIGTGCIIVAQVGISGSVEIGDGVILAGQAGVRDHVKIGSMSMVGAQSGIVGDIPEKHLYTGTPAIPHRTWLRAQNIYSKLPEYVRRIHELERKIDSMEKNESDR